jgi:hypothetical protein
VDSLARGAGAAAAERASGGRTARTKGDLASAGRDLPLSKSRDHSQQTAFHGDSLGVTPDFSFVAIGARRS